MWYRPSMIVYGVCFLAAISINFGVIRDVSGQEITRRQTSGVELPFGSRPTRQEIRHWINNLPQKGRKEAIAAFSERIGKPNPRLRQRLGSARLVVGVHALACLWLTNVEGLFNRGMRHEDTLKRELQQA